MFCNDPHLKTRCSGALIQAENVAINSNIVGSFTFGKLSKKSWVHFCTLVNVIRCCLGPVKDVLQISDCNQSDDGSEDDSDSDEPMHSELESDVDVADSDEDFSLSDEEPLSNISSNSSSQTSKKKKPKQYH